MPADQTVECSVLAQTSPDVLGWPVAVDNCGTPVATFVDSDPISDYEGQCGNTYRIHRVWTVADPYVSQWAGWQGASRWPLTVVRRMIGVRVGVACRPRPPR